jgi:hypothetical protein
VVGGGGGGRKSCGVIDVLYAVGKTLNNITAAYSIHLPSAPRCEKGK